MPNLASAEKRLRQRVGRTERNRVYKGRVRTVLRHARNALLHKDAAQAESCLAPAQKTLDQIAGKGVISKNKAARLKSRLIHRTRALKTAAEQKA